jgi:hypothetical protein
MGLEIEALSGAVSLIQRRCQYRDSVEVMVGWVVNMEQLVQCYYRGSVGQSILVSSTRLRLKTRFVLVNCGFVDGGAIIHERKGLLFTIAAGPRQRSRSRAWVPRDSRQYFTVSHSRLPPTWRTRYPYFYPSWTGWPSYTPSHWVPFSSPSTTSRAAVEVLEPASTRGVFPRLKNYPVGISITSP